MNPPLPMRHGVGASRVWLPDGNWQTMFDFLIEHFPNVSAQSWEVRMQKNQVMDTNSRAIKPNTLYQKGLHLGCRTAPLIHIKFSLFLDFFC